MYFGYILSILFQDVLYIIKIVLRSFSKIGIESPSSIQKEFPMRLNSVAMASVQASRFPSSPSTPAQAQPPTQARTGALVIMGEKISKTELRTYLGRGIERLIEKFEKKDLDVVAYSQLKKRSNQFSQRHILEKLSYYLQPKKNSLYNQRPNTSVSFNRQKPIALLEKDLLTTVQLKEETSSPTNYTGRHQEQQQKRREAAAKKKKGSR
ncbi:MAG: hypothetical protein HEQ32_06785 [Vampirovibrio sp.]